MSYSLIKNIVGGTDVDISDFVVDIEKVPYITRNRDYSLIAEGYEFKLSNQCAADVATGDRLLFYRDTSLIHIGIVETTNLDEASLLYAVKVKHILSELQKRNTGESRQSDGGGGYKSFLDLMKAAADSVSVEGVDYNLIDFKSLVETIINETEVAALSIDWTNTNFYESYSFQWKGVRVGDATLTEGNSESLDESHLWFLPEQINCINQNGLYTPSGITGDEMEARRPSLFELLSMLCSLLGVYFVVKDSTTFYACNVRDAVPAGYFSDDDILAIQTEDEITTAEGIQLNYNTLSLAFWFQESTGDIPLWEETKYYAPDDWVIYNGYYYMKLYYYEAGVIPEGSENWFKSFAIRNVFYQSEGDYQFGENETYFINYIYNVGVKPDYLDWFDNFNPIIVGTSDSWVCIPQVTDDYTALKYQRRAILSSFTKIIQTTPADKIIGSTLYDYESVWISDIANDAVEMEFVK